MLLDVENNRSFRLCLGPSLGFIESIPSPQSARDAIVYEEVTLSPEGYSTYGNHSYPDLVADVFAYLGDG